MRVIAVFLAAFFIAACEPAPAPAKPTPNPPKTSTPAPKPAPAPKPVVKPVTKAITLRWNIPTVREDGSALKLSDIAGYEIYYTTDAGQERTFDVSNPSATSFTTPQLGVGTYHFSLAVYDSAGRYSRLSNIVTTTIK